MLSTRTVALLLAVAFGFGAAWAEEAKDEKGAQPAEGDTAARLAADKAALAPLNNFVGDWKGVGMPRRGSNDGAWGEEAGWAWRFKEGRASLGFASADGKFYREGHLAPGEGGAFVFTGTLPDGKTTESLAGKLNDAGELVLEAASPAAGRPKRITIGMVAKGKRMVMTLESDGGGGKLAPLGEIGFTRKGSGFGKNTAEKECVVTGGLGTIAVSHKGQTYYVCCSGCKDVFDENPEAELAAYQKRKDEEKAKAGK